MLGTKGWILFLAAFITVCAVVPVLNLWVPAGSVFHMSDYAVALLGNTWIAEFTALRRAFLRLEK